MLLAFVVGVIVSAVVAYYTNKSFRNKVQADLVIVDSEVALLKGKVETGTAVVSTDFTKAVTALKSIFSKL